MGPFESIHDRAVGKWRNMLPALGVPPGYLRNKHGPCPICGGKDRFRWDDKEGRGTYYCNGCGPGTGVDLVMKIRGISFAEARREIEAQLPSAAIHMARATQRPRDRRQWALGMWRKGQRLAGHDPGSRYLASRGITFDTYPATLRYLPDAMYRRDDKTKSYHPALMALFTAPDRSAATLHFTYLTDAGGKAELPEVRQCAPGSMPHGGAVRLAPSAETMGIGEGIETALAAAHLFDVPVWAGLSTAGMLKWQPPEAAKCIIIFADHDESFGGQVAAYSLAYRLRRQGYQVEVRLPDQVGDWNDELEAYGRRSCG